MEFGKDSSGRKIDYMRISVTDKCNLKCRYCMPENINTIPEDNILTFDEILEVCKQASELGISKVKITGGEPLLRENCCKLINKIKNIRGIEQVTLTTNGILLEKYAHELYNSGIDAINISLDSVDREKYKSITGYDKLDDVIKGINKMYEYPVKLKINTVTTDVNDYSTVFIAKDRNIDVRFIELMPIGYGKRFKSISNDIIFKKLSEKFGYMAKDNLIHGNGPAVYYSIHGFKGKIGFISAINKKFCNSCNRIRMTADGNVKGCLCYESTLNVREELRSTNYDNVKNILAQTIENKPAGHSFQCENLITEKNEMSRIGG